MTKSNTMKRDRIGQKESNDFLTHSTRPFNISNSKKTDTNTEVDRIIMIDESRNEKKANGRSGRFIQFIQSFQQCAETDAHSKARIDSAVDKLENALLKLEKHLITHSPNENRKHS